MGQSARPSGSTYRGDRVVVEVVCCVEVWALQELLKVRRQLAWIVLVVVVVVRLLTRQTVVQGAVLKAGVAAVAAAAAPLAH